MASNNYYKKSRVKTTKVKKQIEEAKAPVHKFDEDRKKKTIVSVIAIGMVVLMLLTLIVPYIGRVSNTRYELPESALVAGTQAFEEAYNPQMITAAQIFNRPDSTYYVLVGNTSEIANLAPQILRPVYVVDSSVFANRMIQAGTTTLTPQTIEDIRYDGVAILRIVDGHTTGFANGVDAVQSFIDNIE